MSEEYIHELIKIYPFANEKKVAFDLGANKGDYTEKLAQKFEKVYAFEPFPENLEFLRERFANNPKVIIVPKAVSHKTGTAKLYLNGKNSECSLSTIFAQSGAWDYRVTQFIEVETITLDDFCEHEKIKSIGFMKVDVEGAEHSIFRGATQTLWDMEHIKSWIALEAHLLVDWDAVNELFAGHGFKFIGDGFKLTEAMVPGDHYLLHKGNLEFTMTVRI